LGRGNHEEIRKIIKEQLSPEDRLKALYLEIKSDLGDRSPLVMDLYASGYDVDPYVFIKQFGSWLRTKQYCEESLSSFEKKLLDTQGEAFLQHIEKELHPVRSFKMVVLQTLLKLSGTTWRIKDIAQGFLDYFLKHRDKIFDYEDLSRADDTKAFPLSKVVAKLKQMPLHFLSNTENDYFILDKENDKFSLKREIHDYWEDDKYKALIKDRIEFALARYFQRRSLRQTVYFDHSVLINGFPMEQQFAKTFLDKKPIMPGGSKPIKLLLAGKNFDVDLKRSDDGKKYAVNYLPDTAIVGKLSEYLTPAPEKGTKIFHIYAENGTLRIEIIGKVADLRGIVVEIKYGANKDSGYTAEFRQLFNEDPENISWEMAFDKGGYNGAMDVEIRDGDHFLAWTGSRYKDKTRFPARIKAAATALFAEGFRGEFHITATGKKVEIYKK